MATQGKGSKAKGSNFERDISKTLTKWWTGLGFKGEFYRTPTSGGLRWKAREDTVGDLCAPEDFAFTIECKCREDWDFKDIFNWTPDGLIAKWWKQSCDEALRANKMPLLVIKKNYVQPIVFIRANDVYYYNFRRIAWLNYANTINIYIIPLEDFLRNAPSALVKR